MTAINPRPNPKDILLNPLPFILRVIKAFRANQGLLLAGALAYYTLLSIIPLFTFLLVVLSHVVQQDLLIATLTRYLSLVLPGEAPAVIEQIQNFLAHRDVAGWVVVVVMLFFSSMAFTVLENAMSVIFIHRVAVRRRHFLISALMPYLYILVLGVGLLLTSLIAGALQTMSGDHLYVLGRYWALDRLSVVLLYLIGVGGQVLMITSIYMVMPIGRLSWQHALIGGIVAGLLWEATRRALVWYFATLSLVNVVYGSLATTVVGLLCLEVAGIILLFGAQVIAEYERFMRGKDIEAPVKSLRTDVVS